MRGLARHPSSCPTDPMSQRIELLKRVSQEARLLLWSALSQSRGTSQGLYEVEISCGGERGQHQAVRHHV